jgi:hypothetical protein
LCINFVKSNIKENSLESAERFHADKGTVNLMGTILQIFSTNAKNILSNFVCGFIMYQPFNS